MGQGEGLEEGGEGGGGGGELGPRSCSDPWIQSPGQPAPFSQDNNFTHSQAMEFFSSHIPPCNETAFQGAGSSLMARAATLPWALTSKNRKWGCPPRWLVGCWHLRVPANTPWAAGWAMMLPVPEVSRPRLEPEL